MNIKESTTTTWGSSRETCELVDTLVYHFTILYPDSKITGNLYRNLYWIRLSETLQQHNLGVV